MDVILADIIQGESVVDGIFAAMAPAKVGFRLALVQRKLAPILAEYQAARNRLVQKHGVESNKRKGRYHFYVDETAEEPETDTERLAAFNTAMTDLASALVDVDFYITLSDLEKIEAGLSADDLAAVMWLVKEGQAAYAEMLLQDDQDGEDDV